MPDDQLSGGAGTRLRNIDFEIVEGADAATLTTALTAFLQPADTDDERVLVGMMRVAEYSVLILYAK